MLSILLLETCILQFMMKAQHFVLFKPDGYLSQFVINEPRGHRKRLLNEFYDFPEGTMAIGRLDEQSEGLLLLSQDGKLSDFINSSAIEKEYYAQVDGLITQEAIKELEAGNIELSAHSRVYETAACKVRAISTPDLPARRKAIRDERHGPTSWISITLTEGKYRQVRKMTAAVGFPTLRLVRVRIGSIKIENMQAGAVISLPNLAKDVGFE